MSELAFEIFGWICVLLVVFDALARMWRALLFVRRDQDLEELAGRLLSTDDAVAAAALSDLSAEHVTEQEIQRLRNFAVELMDTAPAIGLSFLRSLEELKTRRALEHSMIELMSGRELEAAQKEELDRRIKEAAKQQIALEKAKAAASSSTLAKDIRHG